MPNTEVESTLINPGRIDENHVHVVAAIVWESTAQKKFLIAQRPKGKHLEDYWEFPGGKVEVGESVHAALRRELDEEISIDVITAEPFMRVYYRYPERNVLLDTWTIGEYRGAVQARENQALAWVGIDELDSYRFPPADQPILDAIRNNDSAKTPRCP